MSRPTRLPPRTTSSSHANNSPFAEAGGGSDVPGETQTAFEVGAERVFGRVRVDVAAWHRRMRNQADPNVLFGSNVIFANSVAKPRLVVDAMAALRLARLGRAHMSARVAVLNLFDRAYAYNFGNPFSGTHFGAPRTVSASLRVALE